MKEKAGFPCMITEVSIKQFLAKQGIPELNHPSPHILLIFSTRFFLIPRNQIHAERKKI
jgi:hypothetical protein